LSCPEGGRAGDRNTQRTGPNGCAVAKPQNRAKSPALVSLTIS
jgi:hypothetical protein